MNPEIPSPQNADRRSARRSRASLPDPLIGKRLGRYRILGALGRGGASVVYLAEVVATPASATDTPTSSTSANTTTAAPASPPTDTPTHATSQPAERVAIKTLTIPDDLPEEEQEALRLRFVRETRILERLRHPHILSVIEATEAEGAAYLAMPYIAGGTLARRLTVRRAPLPLDEIGVYIHQIAGALDAAHAFGVVHRDVKPSNVLLDVDAQNAYLTDFGIASLSGDMARLMAPAAEPLTLTLVGTTIGTPSYMAPEQITGERVTPATDIYALGVVAYQLVTGQTPFTGETPLQVAVRQVSDPPRPPRQLRDDLPAPAEAAILRALAKTPADRFPTATAFAAAFAAGLRGEWAPDLDAPKPARRRQRLRLPWRARKPLSPPSPESSQAEALIAVGADERRSASTQPLATAFARRLALATAPYAPTLPLLTIRQTNQRMLGVSAVFSRALASVSAYATAYAQPAGYTQADTPMRAPTVAGVTQQVNGQFPPSDNLAYDDEATEANLTLSGLRRLGRRLRRSLASVLLALLAVALFGLAFAWALGSFPTTPSANAPTASGQYPTGADNGSQRIAPFPTATATPPTRAVSFAVHGRYVYAYDTNGALLWRFKAGGHVVGQPTLGDGVVTITTAHDTYTLSLTDGALLAHHTHRHTTGDEGD